MATTMITGTSTSARRKRGTPTGPTMNDAIDLAAVIGGCTYFTPGRRDGRSFDELTASLAEAVAPCVAYAESRGVRLAIEPSLRTDQSFVHTLRDGADVAERAGIDVIADLGNCWMERDYEATVRRSGDRIAVVQFADAVFGTSERAVARAAARCPATATSPSTRSSRPRSTPGTPARSSWSRSDHDRSRRSCRRAAARRRRGPTRSSRRSVGVSRAIVFNGDETWEMRDLPVPDPQPGGAVMRVEATGLCHSDIDHFQGHVHTSWGGEFPSIAGHEIVGRIEKIDPDGRGASGVWTRATASRCATSSSTRRLPDLRPRLLGRRGLRTLRWVRRTPRAPARFDGVPPPRGPLRRGAHRVRTVELRDHLGGADQPDDIVLIEGPGHMGMATIVAARAAGASQIIVTGVARDEFRLDCALQVGADHVIDVESEDPVARVREITGGKMADVVIDAAAGNPVTVNLAMDLVHPGGHVVIAGMKDRPLEGFHSDWIPTRRITLHPGAGLDTEGAVALINDGKVPTAELLGRGVPARAVRGRLRAPEPRRHQGTTRCASPCGCRDDSAARPVRLVWSGPWSTAKRIGACSSEPAATSTTSSCRAWCTRTSSAVRSPRGRISRIDTTARTRRAPVSSRCSPRPI